MFARGGSRRLVGVGHGGFPQPPPGRQSVLQEDPQGSSGATAFFVNGRIMPPSRRRSRARLGAPLRRGGGAKQVDKFRAGEGVVGRPALGPNPDEAAAPKAREMVRDCALRQSDVFDEFGHLVLAVPGQVPHNREPGRIGEAPEQSDSVRRIGLLCFHRHFPMIIQEREEPLLRLWSAAKKPERQGVASCPGDCSSDADLVRLSRVC